MIIEYYNMVCVYMTERSDIFSVIITYMCMRVQKMRVYVTCVFIGV